MRNQLVIILALGVLFTTFIPLADAQEVAEVTTPTSSEINSLEKQIMIVNDSNSKILDTIYWALGGITTIMLTIVGLNFFQNFSLNKRKIEDIKNKFDAELKSTTSSLQDQNDKNLDSLTKKVKLEIKSEVKSSNAEIIQQFADLEVKISELKRDNLIRSALEHKSKNQMGYILNLVEVLESDIKMKWEWRINESLNLISECLDSFSPNADSLTALQVALNKLPGEYSVQKNNIESKMKTKV